jgi:hypothetical protein
LAELVLSFQDEVDEAVRYGDDLAHVGAVE